MSFGSISPLLISTARECAIIILTSNRGLLNKDFDLYFILCIYCNLHQKDKALMITLVFYYLFIGQIYNSWE